MRLTLPTLIVWLVALLGLAVAGIAAAMFALMATSLDPLEAVNAGFEPWSNALYAVLAFLAVCITTAVGLVAWHRPRVRWLGALLVATQAGFVAWASLKIYAEYF